MDLAVGSTIGDRGAEGRRQAFLPPFAPVGAPPAKAVCPPRLQLAPAGQAHVLL